MLTDVDNVFIDFSGKDPKPLKTIRASEIKEYLEQGQFAPGSMAPKVEAALYFLGNGGERAIITSTGKIDLALEGKAGTQIIK